MEDWLFSLSQLLGWIYFGAWVLSFYGQVLENYQRKSVSGLSFDFELLNFVLYTGDSIEAIWGYFEEDMGTGKVSIPEIFFAVHACVLTMVTIIQIILYYDKNDPLQKVSYLSIIFIVAIVFSVIQLIVIERVLNLYDPYVKRGQALIFNSLVYMGWCKVFISWIKYLPQIYSNYRRKSTRGWNIHNILLDFTGGVFFCFQNIIDGIRNKLDITPVGESAALNIAKYILAFMNMVFDMMFIIQHYYLYKDSYNCLSVNDNESHRDYTLERFSKDSSFHFSNL